MTRVNPAVSTSFVSETRLEKGLALRMLPLTESIDSVRANSEWQQLQKLMVDRIGKGANAVLKRLKYLGIESLSDLDFLKEEDMKTPSVPLVYREQLMQLIASMKSASVSFSGDKILIHPSGSTSFHASSSSFNTFHSSFSSLVGSSSASRSTDQTPRQWNGEYPLSLKPRTGPRHHPSSPKFTLNKRL